MRFVFDLDGTICFRGKPLSGRIIEGLSALEKDGHEVIFASARPIRDMLPVLDSRFHRHLLIGGNGSILSHRGQVIHAETFADDVLSVLLGLIRAHHAAYLIDGDWDYAYTGDAAHPIMRNLDPMKLANNVPLEQLQAVIKILVLRAERLDEMKDKIKQLDVVMHEHKSENIVDINPSNIHKWSALNKAGVPERQFVAFGNDANDVSMFRHACHAVMIGHHPDLAAWATESIPASEAADEIEEQLVHKMSALSRAYR